MKARGAKKSGDFVANECRYIHVTTIIYDIYM